MKLNWAAGKGEEGGENFTPVVDRLMVFPVYRSDRT